MVLWCWYLHRWLSFVDGALLLLLLLSIVAFCQKIMPDIDAATNIAKILLLLLLPFLLSYYCSSLVAILECPRIPRQ